MGAGRRGREARNSLPRSRLGHVSTDTGQRLFGFVSSWRLLVPKAWRLVHISKNRAGTGERNGYASARTRRTQPLWHFSTEDAERWETDIALARLSRRRGDLSSTFMPGKNLGCGRKPSGEDLCLDLGAKCCFPRHCSLLDRSPRGACIGAEQPGCGEEHHRSHQRDHERPKRQQIVKAPEGGREDHQQ